MASPKLQWTFITSPTPRPWKLSGGLWKKTKVHHHMNSEIVSAKNGCRKLLAKTKTYSAPLDLPAWFFSLSDERSTVCLYMSKVLAAHTALRTRLKSILRQSNKAMENPSFVNVGYHVRLPECNRYPPYTLGIAEDACKKGKTYYPKWWFDGDLPWFLSP